MRSRHALLAILVAVVAGLAGSSWLHARSMASDDRPPIVVRGGSIYFDGGVDGNAAECCNNWKKDLIGKQWKPKPDDKPKPGDAKSDTPPKPKPKPPPAKVPPHD